MTQQLPSNHELVLRKLANEHEVAMHKVQTERLRAETERVDAMTRRIWAVGWLVLSLSAPVLGYAAGIGAIARGWLVAQVGDSTKAVAAAPSQTSASLASVSPSPPLAAPPDVGKPPAGTTQ